MALVELKRYLTSMEAEINRTKLGSYGIEAMVFDGVMNIADGANLPSRLMVLDEDFDEALEILSRDALNLNLGGNEDIDGNESD